MNLIKRFESLTYSFDTKEVVLYRTDPSVVYSEVTFRDSKSGNSIRISVELVDEVMKLIRRLNSE